MSIVKELVSFEQYWKMAERGEFDDRKVELIDGEIIAMSPQLNPHSTGVTVMSDALTSAWGPGFWVRVQTTLDCRPYGLPEPDLAVVPGTVRTWRRRPLPTSALLVCEVSVSTLDQDRTQKRSLYAAAGIIEYWILNIVDDMLEMHRDPVPNTTAEFGHDYASVMILKTGDVVSPLSLPTAFLPVADLLP